MPWLRFFNSAKMSFNAICENKILAKISEFTVPPPKSSLSCWSISAQPSPACVFGPSSFAALYMTKQSYPTSVEHCIYVLDIALCEKGVTDNFVL